MHRRWVSEISEGLVIRRVVISKVNCELCIERWWRGEIVDDIKYGLGLDSENRKLHFCELWDDTITIHYSLSASCSGRLDIVYILYMLIRGGLYVKFFFEVRTF